MKQVLLKSLDFTSLNTCVHCINAKTFNTFRKNVIKCETTLNLIHTDVLDHFIHILRAINITRFMYLYLIYHKFKVFNIFKDFKKEVEK